MKILLFSSPKPGRSRTRWYSVARRGVGPHPARVDVVVVGHEVRTARGSARPITLGNRWIAGLSQHTATNSSTYMAAIAWRRTGGRTGSQRPRTRNAHSIGTC